MQETNSNVKNFASQECKQKEKSSHTVNIKKQKNKIKIIALKVGSGWGDSSERRGRATSQLSTTWWSAGVGAIYKLQINVFIQN